MTAAEVLSEFTPQETLSINAIQGATTQLAAVCTRTIAEVRDAIESGGGTLDADTAKITDGLKSDAIAIARWRWVGESLPTLKALQTAPREKAFARAEDKLDSIAKGERTAPASGDAVVPHSGSWNSENRMDMRTTPGPRPPERESKDSANTAND